MRNGFVGVRRNLSLEVLQTLVGDQRIAIAPSYYFLRWPHRISGIQMKLPEEFPSPEGQLFNAELELRWKYQKSGYEVLLLSQSPPSSELEFSSVPGEWEWCDRHAHFYAVDETKFPKGFTYQGVNGEIISPKAIPVKQRYFRDTQTATIHFVALTVGNDHD
ncbi:hypothetical protein [Leptolyngbya sp. 7M]|uniref:hypothetical protein n=1 Tax=Leptolyngbya sp. 7M TaxID=2812896 RepID=UPI001B8C7049|nr:hypothetical protein [Leptolyngbya sp. 7M]QYO68153.1 hypothetical protein JVX88_16135 [Leptolyngbya sp. 7M]